MTKYTKIETERLILRPFSLGDAPEVQRLAGDKDIAANIRTIPHPYELDAAQDWINSLDDKLEHGEIHLAITLRGDKQFVGAIGLIGDSANECAELGYWIGKPYWNKGYCTEAANAMVRYGFEQLNLNRIHAFYMTKNPASGRIMQKTGMTFEGTLRKCIKKWNVFEDVNVYSLLRSEYLKM